jgi:hypothetical protein
MEDNNTNSVGFFELSIDGDDSTSYLKSIDGGWIKAAVLKESIGPENQQVTHHSTLEIDPFSLELGMAGTQGILEWIQESWNKDWGRRSGQITHANFDLKATFEHEFRDALILETTFPALKANGKDPAYLKIKILPQTVVTRIASGNSVLSNPGSKQKLWMTNAFQFVIDGMDKTINTSSIDSITVKQGVQKHYIGKNRFPEIVPTKIERPTITGTIGLNNAADLFKWHDQVNGKETGQVGTAAERTGHLHFLAPNKIDVLFGLNFYHMSLTQLSIAPSTANADGTKQVKFELAVGEIQLDKITAGMD